MDTLKKIMAVLLLIVTGAFLWERKKNKGLEAVADNQEMNDKLNGLTKEIAKNDGQLASEETKREEIKKDTENEKANHDGSASDFNDTFGKG